MCCDMVRVRWCGTVAALAVLAMGLSIGACERSPTADAANAEDEFAALIAEVGPDWEVVEDYIELQREWMRRWRPGATSTLTGERRPSLSTHPTTANGAWC